MAQQQQAKRSRKRARSQGFDDDETDSQTSHPKMSDGQSQVQAQGEGVSVVTIAMFRNFQQDVAGAFSQQRAEVRRLDERVQNLERRVDSLENAEYQAIAAVRALKGDVVERVNEHHERLENLVSTAKRHNELLASFGNPKASAMAPQQSRSHPLPTPSPILPCGPFGTAEDRMNVSVQDLKDQVCESSTRLEEQERRIVAIENGNGLFDRRVAFLEQMGSGADVKEAQITAMLQDQRKRLKALEKAAKQSQCSAARGQEQTLNGFQAPLGQGHPPQKMDEDVTKPKAQPDSPANSHGKAGMAGASDSTALSERITSIEMQLENVRLSVATLECEAQNKNSEEEGQLEFLKRTDFRREGDLLALKPYEDTPLLVVLFSEKDKCEDDSLTVSRACLHKWSYLLCRSREDPKLISDFWKQDHWKQFPVVIELERKADVAKDDNRYYPRYVIELGEIYNLKPKTNYFGGQITHQSTGFHLVMDVTRPEKSLWMVYRYEDQASNGRNLKQSIKYRQDRFWHPFSSVGEFDIAQVYERIEDWMGFNTPVGRYAASRKLVKQTAGLVKPMFVEPIIDEVREEIARGWGPEHPVEGGSGYKVS
ncbi:Uu.00g057430.m01.CDS01 [Anthostomella pinea]|uniref:Uu.00g057430.m01.CDS01 n=1 Tax=Anthostomella pinea TaxID=933095 RepID=A0AAI8YM18_9PEZI|nr:Uu.00g057430.m01.CDS01 [Anthostomella pinea]